MIERLLLGFITNFFDTLGIGSFAPTTAAFRARRLVRDELIPGTLNIGHTPPTIVQAVIYITVIAVDRLTLAHYANGSLRSAFHFPNLALRVPPEAKLSPAQALENLPWQQAQAQPQAQPQPTKAERRAEAKARGYEGEMCNECANFTLVRNGTCMKCDTCGSTTGCS